MKKRTDKQIEEDLLTYTNDNPLLRKLMSKDEIRVANEMVKDGKLMKGISDDKQKTVIYYSL